MRIRSIGAWVAAMAAFVFLEPLGAQVYQARARSFISQAQALGPPAGLGKLTSSNPNTGAAGCAAQLAKTAPDDAAEILIAVGQTLIGFANTTKQTRPYENPKDPIQPFRYYYWQQAIHQLNMASKYAVQLGRTDPQQAAQIMIRIATLYYNSIPTNKSYGAYISAYRQKAKWHLYSSNSESARFFAKKIKDAAEQKAALARIDGLRKSWKL